MRIRPLIEGFENPLSCNAAAATTSQTVSHCDHCALAIEKKKKNRNITTTKKTKVLKQTHISLVYINFFSLATVFNLTFSKLLFYLLILPPASHSKQIFYIIWLQQNLWQNAGLIRQHEREISL